MHVSLWQQYSSNHSASFFLVGEFTTPDEAEKAAAELRQMLFEIGAWWNQFIEGDERRAANLLEEEGQPTPPEEHYRTKYALEEWSQHGTRLDWMVSFDVEDVVTHYDRLVVVNQIGKWGDTWNGAYPLDEILRRLGAKTALTGELTNTDVAVNIMAQAPNDEVIELVKTQIQVLLNYGAPALIFPQLAALNGELVIEHHTIQIKHLELDAQMYLEWHASTKHLPNLWFEEQLDRILQYLHHWGCTDIQYTVVELPDD
jgi:hypothetical protein